MSDAVFVTQISGYVIQIGIDETLRDAEYPQAVDKILFPLVRDDDLVEHVFVADVFQMLQGIVYGKVGVLGVHPQVVFRGAACQNAVCQLVVVVCVLESGQQHFLRGVGVDGINAVAEPLLFIQKPRGQHPDAAVRLWHFSVSLRGEKHRDQGRQAPVKHSGRKPVVLHQGNPASVVVLGGGIVDDLSGAGVEVVGDIPLRLQPLFAALDGRNQCEGRVLLPAVPETHAVLLI